MSAEPEDDALELFVVYESPSDHPGKYVVRKHNLNGPTLICRVCESLAQARAPLIDLGLYRLPRDAMDEPQILETWF